MSPAAAISSLLLLISRMCAMLEKRVPYPHERGPMGGAPYHDGGISLIFEVSESHLDVKEHPGR